MDGCLIVIVLFALGLIYFAGINGAIAFGLLYLIYYLENKPYNSVPGQKVEFQHGRVGDALREEKFNRRLSQWILFYLAITALAQN